MPSATSDAPIPRIPAWQRLGLKLKSAQGAPVAESPREAEPNKRKRVDELGEVLPSKKAKKTKIPTIESPITPNLARKKSVTFTPETKAEDGESIKQLFNAWVTEQKSQDPSFQLATSSPALTIPEPPQIEEKIDSALDEKERRVKRAKKTNEAVNKSKDISKPNKKSGKVTKTVASTKSSSRPFLAYLEQYHGDRENWKFNKNHQNHLLKHVFDINKIPSDHAHLIYGYVRGLQGGVRTRLRDAALAVKVKEQEDRAAGFPEDMNELEKEKDFIKRCQDYDNACTEYVATMTSVDMSSRMGYEEGLLSNLSDYAMKERVAKRIRAEQILAELAAGGDIEGGKPEVVNGDNDSQKRVRMNDGSSQKVARKRKQRTITVDSDSSSSDSSDSDTDSEDSEPPGRNGNTNDTSSSSSSSSSSSDSGEDDDEEDSEDSSDDSGSD